VICCIPKTEEIQLVALPAAALDAKAAAARPATIRRLRAAKPTLQRRATTVDTGERQKMFGYTARHIINYQEAKRLLKEVELGAVGVRYRWLYMTSTVGLCDPKPLPGIGHGGFFLPRAGLGGKQPIEEPKFVDIGRREK